MSSQRDDREREARRRACLAALVLILNGGAVMMFGGTASAMPPPGDPDPRVNLELSVQASYTFDPGTGLFTYSYSVTNDPGSGNSLKTFGLAPIEYVISHASPPHWTSFDRWERRIDALVWTITDNVGALPPDSLDTGDMPPSPYCASPGQTVAGFTLVSRQPPTTVTWYAQGEDTLLDVEAQPFEGILDPDDGFFGLMSVKGTTIGPDWQTITEAAVSPVTEGVISFRRLEPNPFASLTTLEYALRQDGTIRVDVFDLQGRLVRTLADGWIPAGMHSVEWRGISQAGTQVASGVYFLRVQVDGKVALRRPVVLLR